MKLLWLSAFLLILAACTKKETELLSLKSEIIGKVITVSELGDLTHDYAGITLTVEGSDPLITVTTDTSGSYSIKGLPLGNYNFTFSRQGYGDLAQTIRSIGGDKPRNLTHYMYQKTSLVVTNYTTEFNGRTLLIKGSIQHNYPANRMSYYGLIWPMIAVYLNNKPEVSDRNYLILKNSRALQNDPSKFEFSYFVDSSVFPSGSTIYVAMYGRSVSFYNTIYDFDKDASYNTGAGARSEVKSIVVP
jgi:hypothetical protein